MKPKWEKIDDYTYSLNTEYNFSLRIYHHPVSKDIWHVTCAKLNFKDEGLEAWNLKEAKAEALDMCRWKLSKIIESLDKLGKV